MREYTSSRIEWLGIYPKEWKVRKLKYLCKIDTGSKDTQDKIDDGIYPFFVRSPQIERLNEYTHDEEAVMTAGDGVGVGKVFHYYKGKFAVHQRVYVFTKFKNVLGKYIYYFLSSNLAFEVLSGDAKSTVDSLRRHMLANFPITIPPIKEQKKIVGFLDIKLEEIDRLIELKRNLIILFEEKLQSIIMEAVTKGLNSNVLMKDSGIELIGEIPSHWKIKPFKRCFKILNGREIINEVDKDDENGINVYGSGGIFKKTDRYLYEGESVLFGRKGTIGKPIYVNDSFWTVDTMYYTDFYKDSYPKYFYYILSVYPWSIIMTQTALPSIVGSDLANDLWAIPPYQEQIEIAKYLTGKEQEIKEAVNLIHEQIRKLKEYRQSLIYEAVTGKIDVREMVYEKVR